jgi:hypothetical protein
MVIYGNKEIRQRIGKGGGSSKKMVSSNIKEKHR